VENARASEVWLALSVPCFEIWLILHLSEGCPGFNNAAQAGVYLSKLLGTWDKTRLNFDDFRAGVFDAVTRAKRLGTPPDANPSTAAWELIESLRK
jgi:RloB-like protein